jgi:hypothetical protein
VIIANGFKQLKVESNFKPNVRNQSGATGQVKWTA